MFERADGRVGMPSLSKNPKTPKPGIRVSKPDPVLPPAKTPTGAVLVITFMDIIIIIVTRKRSGPVHGCMCIGVVALHFLLTSLLFLIPGHPALTGTIQLWIEKR